MAKIRTAKKPKTKHNEFEIAEACGIYIDCNGDIVATKKALGKGWTQNDLRFYEEQRLWPLLLQRTHQRVNEELVEDAVARRVDQMQRLRNLRIKLYREIIPMQETGKPLAHGVRPNSQEGVAAAICKIIELERSISGDTTGAATPSSGIFTFLRDKIFSERASLNNRIAGIAPGDTTNRFSF